MTTLTNTVDFWYCIARTHGFLVNDNTCTFFYRDTEGNPVLPALFSREVLDGVHPQFLDVLNKIADIYGNTMHVGGGLLVCACHTLYDTLLHWENPGPPSPDFPGMFISQVHEVRVLQTTARNYYDMLSTAVRLRSLDGLPPLVDYTVAKWATRSASWFTTYLPGSLPAIDAALELGYNPHEIAQHVFGRGWAAVQEVTLPGDLVP